MTEERIKLSIKDLKELKTWTLDDIASVLFAEIPHRENKLGAYIDEHGTLLARSVYELSAMKPYKRFAREIQEWVSLSLIYGAPARIDASIKPYLRAFLKYFKTAV